MSAHVFYSLQKTHSLHCVVGVSSWKSALLLIFIMTTRQKVEQRVTTKWIGVRRGTGGCICPQHLLTLYTELAIPVPQSSSSTGVHPGRRGEQMPTSQGWQLLCSGAGFKQSVHKLRLKYWGAHARNNAHIMDRNLNHADDFPGKYWQSSMV